MKETKLNKTAIYCRLSQDDGMVGDSSSIQTQKMMLEQFVKDNNFVLYDIYVDDGYTGLNYNRPGFQRLLEDIENGKIDIVVTKDLSRLGRDYIMTGYYTEIYFPEHNVRYISVNDNIDTLYDNNDIAPFKNILNDMYAKDISRKVKTAKRQRMYKGYYISCQCPYGYKVNPNNKTQLIVDEEVRENVKLIFELSLMNLGSKRICNELNKRGIPTPGAYKAASGEQRFINLLESTKSSRRNYDVRLWNTDTVNKILKDRVYVGDMVNHKYEVKNYKTKKRTKVPEHERIIVKDTHEPIISRDDFEKVQLMISNRKYENNYTSPNLFKSIVKCKKCGRTLTFCYNKRNKSGIRVYKYACMGRYLGDKDIHESVSIMYKDLEEIVTSRLKSLMESIKNKGDAFIEDIISSIDIDSESKQLDVQKTKIESRLNVITKSMKKLYEDNVCGRITDDNYQILLTDFQKEQRELISKLEDFTTKSNKYKTQFDRIKEFRAVADKYLNFTELTNELVHSLIDHIEIDVNTTLRLCLIVTLFVSVIFFDLIKSNYLILFAYFVARYITIYYYSIIFDYISFYRSYKINNILYFYIHSHIYRQNDKIIIPQIIPGFNNTIKYLYNNITLIYLDWYLSYKWRYFVINFENYIRIKLVTLQSKLILSIGIYYY